MEADMNRDSSAPQERYVGQQQADHSFPFPIWGFWILPEPWKITGDSGDSGALLFIDGDAILSPLLFVLLLCQS
jgi:hypothetical protein